MRRRLVSIVAAAAALAVVAVAGRAAAGSHVRKVLGVVSGPVDVDCRQCHVGGTRRRGMAPTGHPDPAAMAFAPDGRTLWIACQGTDELVAADVAGGRLHARVHLGEGSAPHGVAVSPDGRTVYATLRGLDRVVAVDATTLEVRDTAGVGRSPCGLAIDPRGTTLVVAESQSDTIVLLDARTLRPLAHLAAGHEPFAVAVSPDGAFAHVANRLSAVHRPDEVPVSEVTVIDLAARRVASRVPLVSCHLAEGVAFGPDGRSYVALVKVRNLVPITQVARGWVMSGGVAIVARDGALPARLAPTDDEDRYFADPAGVAVSPDGTALFVAAGGADTVSRFDTAAMSAAVAAPAGQFAPIDRLDVAADYTTARIAVGANPRGILASPRGDSLCVAERWDGTLAVLDPRTGAVRSRIDLGRPAGAPSQRRRGDRVFHSSSVTFQSQFGCRSCHPDGHQDGLAYDFESDGVGRNVVDNRSLLGIGGTEPFKWNGRNVDARHQCGPRFAMVLTRADPFPDADLDDLVEYMTTLPAPRPRALSAAAERGRAIFLRTRTNTGAEIPEQSRCVTCHPPPLSTDRRLHDVGSRGPRDGDERFDVPHLAGCSISAPYLHDGRALSLEEIWTVFNPDDTHGFTSDMHKTQLLDLIEYLRAL